MGEETLAIVWSTTGGEHHLLDGSSSMVNGVCAFCELLLDLTVLVP